MSLHIFRGTRFCVLRRRPQVLIFGMSVRPMLRHVLGCAAPTPSKTCMPETISLCRILPDVGQIWPKLGPWPQPANARRKLPSCGQYWPKSGNLWQSATSVDHRVPKVGQPSAKVGRFGPKFGQTGSSVTRSGPKFVEMLFQEPRFGQNLAQNWPSWSTSAKFGQNSARIDQLWRRFA